MRPSPILLPLFALATNVVAAPVPIVEVRKTPNVEVTAVAPIGVDVRGIPNVKLEAKPPKVILKRGALDIWRDLRNIGHVNPREVVEVSRGFRDEQ
jgi:hypothetical protein